MAIREVLQLGNPKLRESAVRVAERASEEIRKDLADTLLCWRNSTGYGRAIAAPQIGAGVRVIFVQLPNAAP